VHFPIRIDKSFSRYSSAARLQHISSRSMSKWRQEYSHGGNKAGTGEWEDETRARNSTDPEFWGIEKHSASRILKDLAGLSSLFISRLSRACATSLSFASSSFLALLLSAYLPALPSLPSWPLCFRGREKAAIAIGQRNKGTTLKSRTRAHAHTYACVHKGAAKPRVKPLGKSTPPSPWTQRTKQGGGLLDPSLTTSSMASHEAREQLNARWGLQYDPEEFANSLRPVVPAGAVTPAAQRMLSPGKSRRRSHSTEPANPQYSGGMLGKISIRRSQESLPDSNWRAVFTDSNNYSAKKLASQSLDNVRQVRREGGRGGG